MDSTELCRLCATEKDTFVDGFVRIYSDEGQKFGLEKKIIRCLQIELCSADALPKSVCLECCSKLHQCADFVESSARAQNRLKILVENNIIPNDSLTAVASIEVKESQDNSPNTDQLHKDKDEQLQEEPPQEIEELETAEQPPPPVQQVQSRQNGEEKDVYPSKYLECVVNEDSERSESPTKEHDISNEAPRSRASKRKCRLPVRVSRVCLDDLDSVNLDAAEISRIFDDDDSEEETRRRRKGRKKRTTSKTKSKTKSKPRIRKNSEKNETDEDVVFPDSNGKDKSEIVHGSENGSKNSDSENIDDNRGNDDYNDELDHDDDYDDVDDVDDEDYEENSGAEKSKSKDRKKQAEVNFSGQVWLCCDCSEELNDVDALRVHHSFVHKQMPKYMCSLCSRVFSMYGAFASHFRRHREDKKIERRKPLDFDLNGYVWLCCDCSEELPDVDALRMHHSNVHKQIPKFMCSICSKVFTHYPGFISHYRRHQENDRYCTCETCGKCFSNKKALDSHRLIHTDKKPFVCPTCGKAFRQQSALYVHSRCHLPDELKNKYACDECDKRFSTKPNLITHKRIHTGIRNYTCDQCGKSFVQKGNLDAHLLTHSNVKPFSCQQCDKSFKTELQLRKHGSVHTGVKPHQCDICGRQFRERGTLREHHRIHTGAMPFSCEFCGKTFRFKGVLTTHRRQHTGERPYSCVQCQHHFTNWPNYNKHMKRRHGINTANNARGARSQMPPTETAQEHHSADSTGAVMSGISTETLQLPHQPEVPEVPVVPLGPPSAPLSVCDSQMQQQPTALLHKSSVETHQPQPQHLYHHENALSQHSLHSQEEDSMSSHHEMYSTHPVHSPLSAHSGHPVTSHVSLLSHTTQLSHAPVVIDDDRELKYATEREIILGQMSRERDRPHFYNPAPGSSVNTNPYLHQSLHPSLHHTLQQSQLPIPSLYAIPQLSLDPSHLEMLHSTASQHR